MPLGEATLLGDGIHTPPDNKDVTREHRHNFASNKRLKFKQSFQTCVGGLDAGAGFTEEP